MVVHEGKTKTAPNVHICNFLHINSGLKLRKSAQTNIVTQLPGEKTLYYTLGRTHKYLKEQCC